MADLSDVEDALTARIVQIVYPGGISVAGLGGKTIKVYRGWPSPIGLNADLAANVSTISVFSDPKTTRDTTRYPRVWRDQGISRPSISLSCIGTSIFVGGSAGAPQVAGLEIDGTAFCVAVESTDTPAIVATSLAALIPGAVVDGTELTIGGATTIVARTAGCGVSTMETRRQEQLVVISLWCPDPKSRDVIAAGLDADLSLIDWLPIADGTAARMIFHATTEIDTSENASLYRRDLLYRLEYPTIITQTSPGMLFGNCVVSGTISTSDETPMQARPRLGALRFDAWYDPIDPIDQQAAAALSPVAWTGRWPANAQPSANGVAWPLATQATLDAEIIAAATAGLDFWAFDSYTPGTGLSRALSLYLTSTIRSKLGFCMLGQVSNWADASTSSGYAASLQRDISLMAQPDYIRVSANRPVYFVLDASADQIAMLPNGSVAQAIDYIRRQSVLIAGAVPYVIWLSGAALADYDNTLVARAIGADAAGAYACPRLNGAPQTYQDLVATAVSDWAARSQAGLPMVATAMTGWDQRPLIETPQPFYPIGTGVTDADYYAAGSPSEIASHIAAAWRYSASNSDACPAGLVLIYAWNELAEGGWLLPTFTPDGPDMSRVEACARAMGKVSSQRDGSTTITV
jgi:hypothetical protein